MQQVVDLTVGGPRALGVPRADAHVHGEVVDEDVGDEVVPAEPARGQVVEALEHEEGELVLEQQHVVVHVLHRPRGVDERVLRALLPLEEELHQEAAVQEEHLGELGRGQQHGLRVPAARGGLHRARGAGVRGQRRAAGAGQNVAEVPPLVLLHGGEVPAGATVEGPDGDHLRLVEVPVAVAHGPRHAEDGERLALVRIPGQRRQAPSHARRHVVGLRVVTNLLLFILPLHGAALVQPALHGRGQLVPLYVAIVVHLHVGVGECPVALIRATGSIHEGAALVGRSTAVFSRRGGDNRSGTVVVGH
uniref:Uncharacterized protein n=1 Tax=Zea mays TaxID=4577 RepID=A0A804NZL6_MAIZE